MEYRFTLSHDILGVKVISEPDGFDSATLKLTRHEEFHSLIEYYEGEFIFYGSDGIVDGGIDFIREVESQYGHDADLRITIEVAADDLNFETLFEGLLKLSELEELPDNKMQVPIIPEDLWTKFINRQETQVDVFSPENVDGGSADIVSTINLNLPSQKIRYVGQYNWLDSVTYESSLDDDMQGMQLDWEDTEIDDLKKFTLPRVKFDAQSDSGFAGADDFVIGLFEAPWTGDFTFDIRIETGIFDFDSSTWIGSSDEPRPAYFIKLISEKDTLIRYPFTETKITYGSDIVFVHEISITLRIQKGDQIAIYGLQIGAINDSYTVFGERRLQWKPDAYVATIEPITLSGEQTIDGESILEDYIVLVKNQLDPGQNGLWICKTGAWVRAVSMNTADEFTDAAIAVLNGDTNAGSGWRVLEPVNVVGTSPVIFGYIIPSDERYKPYPGTTVDNHLRIYADTIYKDSDIDPILTHDLGGSIVDRITGVNQSFYSELLGSMHTKYREYDFDGCQWQHAITHGLQLRGYSFDEKILSMSFKKWWEGMNPIFNLGLSCEVIDGNRVIRVEEKRHYYDDSVVSVNISNVRDIVRKYDENRLFKSVKVGYRKWQAEDISGIDDPQTKKTYITRLQKSGKEFTIESDFIAASLAIETTRRKSIERANDYKFDNDIFIIAVNRENISPELSPGSEQYTPQLDEDFGFIDNLLNPETRYNLKLTPARNFIRWRDWLSAGLQSYTSDPFKFSYGEGNYDMISVLDANPCGEYTEELSERGDLPVSVNPFHLALIYEIRVPLTSDEYAAIRNTPKLAIGVSQTESNHVKFFIDDIEYNRSTGECVIQAWPTEFMPILIIQGSSELECFTTDECANAYLTEDLFEYETESGECLVLN